MATRESAPGPVRGSMSQDGGVPQDRRGNADRRSYSRRGMEVMGPPYIQTFDRIASALERIEEHLRQR